MLCPLIFGNCFARFVDVFNCLVDDTESEWRGGQGDDEKAAVQIAGSASAAHTKFLIKHLAASTTSCGRIRARIRARIYTPYLGPCLGLQQWL